MARYFVGVLYLSYCTTHLFELVCLFTHVSTHSAIPPNPLLLLVEKDKSSAPALANEPNHKNTLQTFSCRTTRRPKAPSTPVPLPTQTRSSTKPFQARPSPPLLRTFSNFDSFGKLSPTRCFHNKDHVFSPGTLGEPVPLLRDPW